MDQKLYVEILNSIMHMAAEWNMPIKWVFQPDNDPKHTIKLTKEWFRVNVVEAMSGLAQSPDLNLVEHL